MPGASTLNNDEKAHVLAEKITSPTREVLRDAVVEQRAETIREALREAEERGAERMYEACRRTVAPISGGALAALQNLGREDVLEYDGEKDD